MDDAPMEAAQSVIEAQEHLLGLLDGPLPAGEAASSFTDIRVMTALLRASWPLGQDLMPPGPAGAADEHIRHFGRGKAPAYPELDRSPSGILAAAGLLAAAITILHAPDLAGTLACHVHAALRNPRVSRFPGAWRRLIARHDPACSPELREAVAQVTREALRIPAGQHGSPRLRSRVGGYGPEHVPALLRQQWYDDHLAVLGYPDHGAMRRVGAILLVQSVTGGSLAQAAQYLGTRDYADPCIPQSLAAWLRERGSAAFVVALDELADRLDRTTGLTNYQNRREAMRDWWLDPECWQKITKCLPPPAVGQEPGDDDRVRHQASAFVWSEVTRGEAHFAPWPADASPPGTLPGSPVGRRPRRKIEREHLTGDGGYPGLRELLIGYAGRLARDIDSGSMS